MVFVLIHCTDSGLKYLRFGNSIHQSMYHFLVLLYPWAEKLRHRAGQRFLVINVFHRGSVLVFLRKPIATCDFQGESGPPAPPSGSAHDIRYIDTIL